MATNCPNCGAPLKNGICEYCGTEVDPGAKRELQREMDRLNAELRRAELEAWQSAQTQYLISLIGPLSRKE